VDKAAGQQASRRGSPPKRRPVEDGTAYWTLSFYMSRAQIIGHDLAMPLEPGDGGYEGCSPGRDKRTDKFNLSRYFVDHKAWDASQGGTKTLDDLRRLDRFDARERVENAVQNAVAADRTSQLRSAINPLFNDIADRSRLGRIEDQLFAVEQSGKAEFVLPNAVQWSTEGRTYSVPTDPDSLRYPVHVTRFWYLHANGAMSWHVSFDVNYRNPAFSASLAQGKVPNALYLLSLMQKLAYPKESEVSTDAKEPVGTDKLSEQDKGTDPVRSDKLFELRLRDQKSRAKPELFWDVIGRWFEQDKPVIGAVHNTVNLDNIKLLSVCPNIAVNEIPGLFCVDTRSNFFIKDDAFFRLIQPKTSDGELEPRRKYVLDEDFQTYPALIEKHAKITTPRRGSGRSIATLGPEYWTAMLAPDAEARPGEGAGNEKAVERLLYLFLAGFNQNIIDWTNQDASEVLDSLDPIYPSSDDQLEEGFFIRYANPRCLITYVQRSRTLEVGNDFIGTCPYAFLIHVLAMHNERLTRDQEKLAFAVVEKVNHYMQLAEAGKRAEAGPLIQQAEEWINWYRMAAFEHFDRHRYFNPFRYDTERDVFDALEQLRGTSRLIAALDKAFAGLDESTRDLERVRAEAEADWEDTRNLILTVVFGIVGLAGLAQVVLQVDDLRRDPKLPFTYAALFWDVVLTLCIAAFLAAVITPLIIRLQRR
jgi:hypothetical protein